MRNRTEQPAPLDLPPVEIPMIRIYGQLIGPMRQPIANTTIILRAVTTNAIILNESWSETTTDASGNYDFSVIPGRYAVFIDWFKKPNRLNNIVVYGDSAPGNLQSFMLATPPDQLMPVMILETKAAAEESSAAMLRSRQWAENPVDVPVLDFEQGAGPEYSAYHWANKAKDIVNADHSVNWRDTWDAGTAYAYRDAVQYNGSSYYCVKDNTGQVPPDIITANSEFWSLMAAKGDKGDKGLPGSVMSVNEILPDATGDVELTAADVHAISDQGGNYPVYLRLTGVETLATEPAAANLSSLYSAPAPIPSGTVAAGGVANWYNYEAMWGLIRNASTGINGWGILINGVTLFLMAPDGSIYSSNEKQATENFVNQNFVQDTQLGAETNAVPGQHPAGWVATAYDSDTNQLTALYIRPEQKKINGQWYTVGGL